MGLLLVLLQSSFLLLLLLFGGVKTSEKLSVGLYFRRYSSFLQSDWPDGPTKIVGSLSDAR